MNLTFSVSLRPNQISNLLSLPLAEHIGLNVVLHSYRDFKPVYFCILNSSVIAGTESRTLGKQTMGPRESNILLERLSLTKLCLEGG